MKKIISFGIGGGFGAVVFCILLERWSLAGAVLGFLSAIFIHPFSTGGFPIDGGFRKSRYFVHLLYSIIQSTARLIAAVFRPGQPPAGILSIPAGTSEEGRVIVSNSITLTPGTVTLDESEEAYTVLCMNPPESPEERQKISADFEKYWPSPGKEEVP